MGEKLTNFTNTMKGHRIYHLLILIVINSALGTEDWPSEREKVLGRFTRIHRDFRELNMTLKTEKENVMTQIEDLQNTQKVINDQNSDEIEGLKDLINEKQKDMDELIQNDMKKENQINELIMRVNNMEIQGIYILTVHISTKTCTSVYWINVF